MSNYTDVFRLKRLGSRAADLLQDADFKDILADLKNRAIRGWAETDHVQSMIREEFWHDLQAISRLENLMAELGQQARAEEAKNEAQDRKDGRR